MRGTCGEDGNAMMGRRTEGRDAPRKYVSRGYAARGRCAEGGDVPREHLSREYAARGR